MVLLLLACLVALYNSASLYPYTLLNTDVPCKTLKDCSVHYNHSWCVSAGVMCIQHYCKLIPEYPCRATQDCLEETQECRDKPCKSNEECSNGLYCDGEEVCHHGFCITEVTRPSCHYTGGRCDEESKTCYQPKVRLAWRSFQEENDEAMIQVLAAVDNLTRPVISQTTVNVTSLIIVAGLTALVILVFVVYVLGKSLGPTYTKLPAY